MYLCVSRNSCRLITIFRRFLKYRVGLSTASRQFTTRASPYTKSYPCQRQCECQCHDGVSWAARTLGRKAGTEDVGRRRASSRRTSNIFKYVIYRNLPGINNRHTSHVWRSDLVDVELMNREIYTRLGSPSFIAYLGRFNCRSSFSQQQPKFI